MKYNKFYLTKEGRDLLARTTLGEVLKFTRVAFGTGTVTTTEQLINQKALIDQRLSVKINSIQNNKDGTATIHIAFNNEEVTQGFLMKEIGVFAQDPVKGEILYFILNCGEEADFFPAKTTKLVEQTMDLIVVVGDSPEVTIVLDQSLVFVTRREFLHAVGDGWSDENVKKNADDIRNLQLDVASLKGTLTNDMLGKNSFLIQFTQLTEEEEYEGIWDSNKARLGIYPVAS